MGKQNQIPTSQFVPPYPQGAPKEQLDVWFSALAGFANGAQSVKRNDALLSLRVGSVVFVEGSIEVDGAISSLSVLPVKPRLSGFIQVSDSNGNLKGVGYTAGSKDLDVSGLTSGTYLINGWYLVQLKDR